MRKRFPVKKQGSFFLRKEKKFPKKLAKSIDNAIKVC